MSRARALRGLAAAVLTLAGLFAFGEIAVRRLGIADVPLYRADPILGYALQPNQAGSFRNRARWVINARGFGMAEACDLPRSVLLVGDSLAQGVLATDQPQRLGPQLAGRIGRPVCPLGASSWTLTNELRALGEDPALLAAGQIVMLTNAEDFGAPSVWLSEMTHPRTRPPSRLAWVLWRQFGPPYPTTSIAPTSAAEGLWRPLLERFITRRHTRLLWVIYPKRTNIGYLEHTFDEFERQLAGRLDVLDLRREPRWTARWYRDDMHPTDAGNAMLARLIAERLTTRLGS